ncbi:MAG: GGDEF domain-containing protein [Acidimicrobiales bacterium]
MSNPRGDRRRFPTSAAGGRGLDPDSEEIIRRMVAAAESFRQALEAPAAGAGAESVGGPVTRRTELPGDSLKRDSAAPDLGSLDSIPLDLDRLAELVNRAEVAIGAAQRVTEDWDRTEKLILTDPLTGLWNRRHLDVALKAEAARSARFSEPFSVLFCDVDGFKAINDLHGHRAGDEVLVGIAQRILDCTREVDLVFRYGGDEITLVLPRTGPGGALRLADKVRRAVAGEGFPLGCESVLEAPSATPPGTATAKAKTLGPKSLVVRAPRVKPPDDDARRVMTTISVGVGTFPDQAQSTADLLSLADQALYRAKSAGGNRVEPGVARADNRSGPPAPRRRRTDDGIERIS